MPPNFLILWLTLLAFAAIGIMAVLWPEQVRQGYLRITKQWDIWPCRIHAEPDAADLIRAEGIALLIFVGFVLYLTLSS